jgi:hypothetical protein
MISGARRFFTKALAPTVVSRRDNLVMTVLDQNYRFQEAKDLLTDLFANKNPWYAGKVSPERDWKPVVSQIVDVSLPEKISFIITDQDNGRLVHAMVSHDLCTKVDTSNMSFTPYRQACLTLLKSLSQPFRQEHEHKGPGHALYMDLGATTEGYERKGIQTWSIEKTLETAKEKGYSVAAMIATNPINRRTGERVGFQVINEIETNEVDPQHFVQKHVITFMTYKL